MANIPKPVISQSFCNALSPTLNLQTYESPSPTNRDYYRSFFWCRTLRHPGPGEARMARCDGLSKPKQGTPSGADAGALRPSGDPDAGGDGQLEMAVHASDNTYLSSGTASDASYSGLEFDQLIGAQNKLFDYPDMCKFQIMLHNNYTNELTTLFESGRCVIESVAVDYGSGNKMTFFDSDINEHFPTDVTLSIGLKETQLQTAPTLAVDSENTMI